MSIVKRLIGATALAIFCGSSAAWAQTPPQNPAAAPQSPAPAPQNPAPSPRITTTCP